MMYTAVCDWMQKSNKMSDGKGLRCLALISNDAMFGVTSLKLLGCCCCYFFFFKNTTPKYKTVSRGSYGLLYNSLLCRWLPVPAREQLSCFHVTPTSLEEK